jgi:hypothetical protein
MVLVPVPSGSGRQQRMMDTPVTKATRNQAAKLSASPSNAPKED